MTQYAMAPPPPLISELKERLFTVVNLQSEVAELSSQLATAIGDSGDH